MFSPKKLLPGMIVVVGLMLSACSEEATDGVDGKVNDNSSGLANPASVYCEGLGFELEMRSSEEGTYGVCVYPDGSECEEGVSSQEGAGRSIVSVSSKDMCLKKVAM